MRTDSSAVVWKSNGFSQSWKRIGSQRKDDVSISYMHIPLKHLTLLTHVSRVLLLPITSTFASWSRRILVLVVGHEHIPSICSAAIICPLHQANLASLLQSNCWNLTLGRRKELLLVDQRFQLLLSHRCAMTWRKLPPIFEVETEKTKSRQPHVVYSLYIYFVHEFIGWVCLPGLKRASLHLPTMKAELEGARERYLVHCHI